VGFCFIGCLLFSCVDDTGKMGLELQNPDDRVLVFSDSSMKINTYTVQRSDTIITSPGIFLLGQLNDPKIGSFYNNFMSEVDMPNPDFGDNPIVDSLMFYMAYGTTYGDTNSTQLINIYQLKLDTALRNIGGQPNTEEIHNTFIDKTTRLGVFSYIANPNDSIIRVRLPKKLGEKLLDSLYYTSQDSFHRYLFRGLAFEAQKASGIGAVTSFSIGSTTRMELFYHNINDSDSVVYSSQTYNIATATYHCNTYKRIYNTDIKFADFETIPDESIEQEHFYIKNNDAFESIIKISGLQTWKDSGYFAINKALLSLYPEEALTVEDSLFPPISNLEVWKIDTSDFSRTYLTEYYAGGYKSISRSLLSEYYKNKSVWGYEIDIKNTLYSAIQNGEENLWLMVTTSNGATNPKLNHFNASRTVFKGAKNTENPLKLKIAYTKFNAE